MRFGFRIENGMLIVCYRSGVRWGGGVQESVGVGFVSFVGWNGLVVGLQGVVYVKGVNIIFIFSFTVFWRWEVERSFYIDSEGNQFRVLRLVGGRVRIKGLFLIYFGVFVGFELFVRLISVFCIL